MVEERESVFLLCCCHRPLIAGAASGTNGASSGSLFPSDGHSWGDPPPRARVTPPSHPAATSSPMLLPPSPATLLGLSFQSAA